jgi:2-oxoglutarate dehydrogenase complex dehydrogenase (E1) component-like enzyme
VIAWGIMFGLFCNMQIHRSFRKPLIIFTPKNLLRHPKAKSQLLEFDDQADDPNIVGVRFKRLIMDNAETDRSPNPTHRSPDVQRLIFCSGKVYYELEATREEAGQVGKIAICRVEQLAPFPFDLVMRELKRYPNAEVCFDRIFQGLAQPYEIFSVSHHARPLEVRKLALGRPLIGSVLRVTAE